MKAILCAIDPDRKDLTETDAQEIRDTFAFAGVRADVLTTETMELDIILGRHEDQGVAAQLLRKRGMDIL